MHQQANSYANGNASEIPKMKAEIAFMISMQHDASMYG